MARISGTPNRITTEYKDLIASAGVVEFLLDAFKSGTIPNSTGELEAIDAKERIDIAKFLVKKIIPDVKAIELNADSAKEFIVNVIKYGNGNPDTE